MSITRIKMRMILLCLIVHAAAGLYAGPLSGYQRAAPGEYVLYRDHSWKQPTWIGFLQYDESTYGALLVTPASGVRVSILFRVEASDDRMILVGQKNILKPRQEDVPAVNYLMGLLPDMYAWRQAAAGGTSTVGAPPAGADPRTLQDPSSLLPSAVFADRDIASFGGKVVLTWAPEVSVFNLRSIRQADGTPILELARMGRIGAGGDNEFFSFAPPSSPAAGVALSIPATRARESKTVDGIRLDLDSQWTMIADNTFFLGNAAMLVVDTLDLVLLGLPGEGLPLSLVRQFSSSSKAAWANPAEFRISGSPGRFRIENLFRDAETGRDNRDVKLCIPSPDGRRCVVVSLSVSETAYRANKAYFDSLF